MVVCSNDYGAPRCQVKNVRVSKRILLSGNLRNTDEIVLINAPNLIIQSKKHDHFLASMAHLLPKHPSFCLVKGK